ncbi:hypothetical protein N8J89_15050 [Crossiella sp. CA-258035]|uniref:hypothetical protein n=1 Tax=Crossiella sp. CA-258035 TaxID=2981138 RepID=UPI0024BC608A|nr:hypothetical protein [Crossiella sp. CA-258035]WHT22329.1 hypothetical protein N8J89_15050 [Crossiella sp. CA-258035]
MNILAGVIGAVLSLIGVLLGVWLNGRREERRWLRDNKLASATDYIAAAGNLYNFRRKEADARPEVDEQTRAEWTDRMQRSRAAIHLLCEPETVQRLEDLSAIIWRTKPADDRFEDSTAALSEFTKAVRAELTGRSSR